MMKHTRQELITLLHCNGIGLTGNETDKCLKLYNDFQMPISERVNKIITEEQDKFLEFVKNWLKENYEKH